MAKTKSRKLTASQSEEILATLEARFNENLQRHEGVTWEAVRSRLEGSPDRLWSLREMEASGGEPDVIGHDAETGACLFVDCVLQSPAGRRSVCYDHEALEARKKHKPENSAMAMADAMGAAILTVEQYHALQKLGPVDTKTSSWLLTPPDIRDLGGAIFGDWRYGTVFVYHNGADSYYAARGFRCALTV